MSRRIPFRYHQATIDRTKQILLFAGTCHRKIIHYMSSIGVHTQESFLPSLLHQTDSSPSSPLSPNRISFNNKNDDTDTDPLSYNILLKEEVCKPTQKTQNLLLLFFMV